MTDEKEPAVVLMIDENFVKKSRKRLARALIIVYFTVMLLWVALVMQGKMNGVGPLGLGGMAVMIAIAMLAAFFLAAWGLPSRMFVLGTVTVFCSLAKGRSSLTYGAGNPLTLAKNPGGRWWILATRDQPDTQVRVLVAAFPFLNFFLSEKCPHFIAMVQPGDTRETP